RAHRGVLLESVLLCAMQAPLEVARDRELGGMLLAVEPVGPVKRQGECVAQRVAQLARSRIRSAAHHNSPSSEPPVTSLRSFSCSRILRTYAALVVMPIVFATSSIGKP